MVVVEEDSVGWVRPVQTLHAKATHDVIVCIRQRDISLLYGVFMTVGCGQDGISVCAAPAFRSAINPKTLNPERRHPQLFKFPGGSSNQSSKLLTYLADLVS